MAILGNLPSSNQVQTASFNSSNAVLWFGGGEGIGLADAVLDGNCNKKAGEDHIRIVAPPGGKQ